MPCIVWVQPAGAVLAAHQLAICDRIACMPSPCPICSQSPLFHPDRQGARLFGTCRQGSWPDTQGGEAGEEEDAQGASKEEAGIHPAVSERWYVTRHCWGEEGGLALIHAKMLQQPACLQQPALIASSDGCAHALPHSGWLWQEEGPQRPPHLNGITCCCGAVVLWLALTHNPPYDVTLRLSFQ